MDITFNNINKHFYIIKDSLEIKPDSVFGGITFIVYNSISTNVLFQTKKNLNIMPEQFTSPIISSHQKKVQYLIPRNTCLFYY